MEKIFKAKRLDNGEWYYFLLNEINEAVLEAIDQSTISQSTSINDSQGNRIFEGDRVYIAGVGKVIVAMTPNGVTFSGWDYQDVIEDIEKLTGNSIHDKVNE